MTLNTTAFAPIASASVRTAASANPGDLRNMRKAEAHILDGSLNEISAQRLVAFLLELLLAAELDARTALGFAAVQSGTFQIFRA